jgi:hypothetical protein
MQTHDPIQEAILDPQYTTFQRESARATGTHPKFWPASEADLPEPAGGPTRFHAPGEPAPSHAPTPAEQAAELASIYGVAARYIPLDGFVDEAAEQRQAELDAKRLARRDALALKFGVRPEHIPLEWLDPPESAA